VSHDLRGTLDAINGFTYLPSHRPATKLNAQTLELVGNIRSSGKRMAELIDDLLNLSRVTKGALRWEKLI